jgi:DNA ligase-1
VQDYEVGPMRIIDKNTGLETTIETLKSVIIDHKGNQVNVGSGFTIPERQKYYDHPKLILGKTISVRYFEEIPSENRTKFSLRFPTFVALHGKTREL